MSGTLFIIGTPIGNLDDLSPRVRSCLAACDVIFAEDTRHTLKLLNYLGLKKRLISCREFRTPQLKIFEQFAQQELNIGLVSDAGMPLISDPGLPLVQKAIGLGLTVTPIPGPSACLLAVAASGFAANRFSFEGFLPDNKTQRRLRLEQAAAQEQTLVFYIAPHDLKTLLPEILEVLGPRNACLAKEITKKYERFIYSNLDSLLDKLEDVPLRGEFVLVVEGIKSTKHIQYTQEQIVDKLKELKGSGTKLSDAAAQVAKLSGWPRSKIYKLGTDALKC